MIHAKIQDNMTSGSGEDDFLKVFTIYVHGGHLGHVTWTIYIKGQGSGSRLSSPVKSQNFKLRELSRCCNF